MPDWAPSDFHLFPNLWKYLAENRFVLHKGVRTAVNKYFADLSESHKYTTRPRTFDHQYEDVTTRAEDLNFELKTVCCS